MDRYKEDISINNDIYQNHVKHPERGAGDPEPGSLPRFPCSPTSFMAAISSQQQATREPSLQPWWRALH